MKSPPPALCRCSFSSQPEAGAERRGMTEVEYVSVGGDSQQQPRPAGGVLGFACSQLALMEADAPVVSHNQ